MGGGEQQACARVYPAGGFPLLESGMVCACTTEEPGKGLQVSVAIPTNQLQD